MRPNPSAVLIRLIVLLTLGLTQCIWAAGNEVTVGVLAFRPKPETLARWRPTADYLAARIGEPVKLEALNYQELEAAIRRQGLDFVLTNPAHYVLMTKRNGLSSPLATLIEEQNGQALSTFGGVIATLSERGDVNTLDDLRGKTVATPDIASLGGYQAQAYQLIQAGLSMPGDVRLLVTGMPHDSALNAVLEGRADACFVRTGVIESLIHEGKLARGRLKVLNRKTTADFPFLLSTRLYPEWPFAAMPRVDERLARRVAAALYAMTPNDPAARMGGYMGWAIPVDYEPVRELLQQLRLPPYDRIPAFTWQDVVEANRASMAVAFVGLAAIVLLLVLLGIRNRQLQLHQQQLADDILRRQAMELELKREAETRRQLLAALGEGVYGIDVDGACTFVNPAAWVMLDYTEEELLGRDIHSMIHHHLPDGQPYAASNCPIYLTQADGQTRHAEEWFFKKDGTGFPVEITVAPTKREDERVGAVVVFRDISERKHMEEELQTLATTDSLTGLPNRRHFLSFLEQENARLRRYQGTASSLLMLDLDHFKLVNDSHGHAVGDVVLRRFAGTVRKNLRKTDHAGRLGGEEFAILLFGTDIEGAAEFAERLRRQVEAEKIDTNGTTVHITVSIGATQLSAADTVADAALVRADEALYRAKANGRNRVESA